MMIIFTDHTISALGPTQKHVRKAKAAVLTGRSGVRRIYRQLEEMWSYVSNLQATTRNLFWIYENYGALFLEYFRIYNTELWLGFRRHIFPQRPPSRPRGYAPDQHRRARRCCSMATANTSPICTRICGRAALGMSLSGSVARACVVMSVEFTQHAGDEIFKGGASWIREWTS
jgi:hypothetical protein